MLAGSIPSGQLTNQRLKPAFPTSLNLKCLIPIPFLVKCLLINLLLSVVECLWFLLILIFADHLLSVLSFIPSFCWDPSLHFQPLGLENCPRERLQFRRHRDPNAMKSLAKGMAGSSTKTQGIEYQAEFSLQSGHMCSNAPVIQDVNEYHMWYTFCDTKNMMTLRSCNKLLSSW